MRSNGKTISQNLKLTAEKYPKLNIPSTEYSREINYAVYKFGYYDQSHLLRDFHKHHLMTPKEALTFSYQNC